MPYDSARIASDPTEAWNYLADRIGRFRSSGNEIKRQQNRVRDIWERARELGNHRVESSANAEMRRLQGMYNRWFELNDRVDRFNAILESYRISPLGDLGNPLVVPAALIVGLAVAIFAFNTDLGKTIQESNQSITNMVREMIDRGATPEQVRDVVDSMTNAVESNNNAGGGTDISRVITLALLGLAGIMVLPQVIDLAAKRRT